jgi:hypothetical protein
MRNKPTFEFTTKSLIFVDQISKKRPKNFCLSALFINPCENGGIGRRARFRI